MYQHFYGLRELPFELTPNPKYLYLPPRHREALSTLEYGLSSAKPVTALIGEAGTGKTTLIYAALESERCRNVNCVYLNNPLLTRKEFVETLSRRFGLSAHAATSKAGLLDELGQVLKERRARGQITALVIDEAQSMSGVLLEEIRLLANTETPTEKLLPLVLAGQPELTDRLNEPGLRQLKQRVTLRCTIEPFSIQETAAYIAHRIRMAGGDAAKIFTREAVMLIHERSSGIPRTISVICDNALLTGFALGRHTLDSSVVLEVAYDFDLGGSRTTGETLPVDAGDSADVEDVETAQPDFRVVEASDNPTTIIERIERIALPPPDVPEATVSDEQDLQEREMFVESRRPSRFSFFGRRN